MQCQERQQEQNQPIHLSEGMECLSINHSEVFLVMLRSSQPGQQRETPLTAWLGVWSSLWALARPAAAPVSPDTPWMGQALVPLPQARGWPLLAPCCTSRARPAQTKPREDTRAKLCQGGPDLEPARKTITTAMPASRGASQGNHSDPGPSKMAAA